MNRWTRRLHRWGALITFVPLFLVIASGILLQVKKQFPWVQPPTEKGTTNELVVNWNQILKTAAEDPRAKIHSWDDIDRLDVRPGKGIIKVRCKNRWEIQIDSSTGDLLSSAYRRSDFIESLHDGSFFSDGTKLWVFLPNGIVLLGLWISGGYLWYIHFASKRKQKLRKKLKRTEGQFD